MRALVIDDSKAMRMLLKRELSRSASRSSRPATARRRSTLLGEQGAIDVVLVDWTMPVMDGMSFVQDVRAEPTYERVLVVMVTSESDPAQIFQALMAGVDEYATKPITREALAEKLGLVGLVEQD